MEKLREALKKKLVKKTTVDDIKITQRHQSLMIPKDEKGTDLSGLHA